MRRLILGAGLAGVAGLTALSLYLNFQFGLETGGLQLGFASLCLDCVKIALPAIMAIAALAKGHSRILRGCVITAALPVWLLLTLYSSQSASGAVLLSRLAGSDSRALLIDRRRDLSGERTRLQEKLKRDPWTARIEPWRAKPSASIAAEIAAYRNSWKWQASRECKSPDGTLQLNYCQLFHTMEAALEVAGEVEAQSRRLTEVERELGNIPVLVAADPHIQMAADLSGVDQKWVLYAWAGLAALLIELVPNVMPAMLLAAAEFRTPIPHSAPSTPRGIPQAASAEIPHPALRNSAAEFRSQKPESIAIPQSPKVRNSAPSNVVQLPRSPRNSARRRPAEFSTAELESAVRRHGSNRAAAAALGINEKSIRTRLADARKAQ